MQKRFRTAVVFGALALGTAAVGAAFFTATAARAEIQYPWCAEYGGDDANAVNCGFTTLAQCRATISGMGGFCHENPAYTGAVVRPKKAKAH